MRGFLGLGSNEGDRLVALETARAALPPLGVEVTRSSSAYETAPQGEVTDQPDYLNACLEVETGLDPESLLDVCKEIELAMGREPDGARHGPRPIDLDVLLLGSLEHVSERLSLPHPEVTARRFVLEPLLELDEGLELPGGRALKPLLADVAGQPVVRFGDF
ncbi:MAG: 2-amino-4-hydroxy-6-hydroxymethyldihydropteridine diphosphokinase [Thermoleophilaceae bacterium]